MTEIHMGVLHEHTEIPGHHAELLAALGGRAGLGLCSNFSHTPTARRILAEAGFEPHLRAVAISDAVGWRKPRGEIFEAVLGELDARPEEVLHVGDSLRADVGGAAALGIRSVWVTRRIRDPERRLREHEGPTPDFVVADLAELGPLLDELGSG
jgi:FMN phosphatase YigB (HAD superfamily)